MPIYEFQCGDCGAESDLVESMKADIPEAFACWVHGCRGRMHRVYGFTTPGGSYAKPLVSDALAMNPNQIAEHRRKFPNIKVHPDGRPEFTSFKQHDDYLKATGFQKKSQKNRVRRTKIHKKADQIS